mgnify:CR=1 FL=1
MTVSTGRPLLREGEKVTLVDDRGKVYYFTLEQKGEFHFHKGMIKHDDVLGKKEGCMVLSSSGTSCHVFRPLLRDYVLKMPRKTQIIYPKDMGIILMWADVFPGARVLEAGTGSGALTMTLLRAVGENGVLYTYEMREEMARVAVKNVERFMGEKKNLVLKLQDVYEGIDEEDLDRVILDLVRPWDVVKPATRALAPGGIFLCFVPTVVQVQAAVEALRGQGSYRLVESMEVFLRQWNIEGRSVRPYHRMVAHSGFIVTARKTSG